MQMVEQGKLDLRTDIREYLPEGFFRKLKYDEPITLLNLMHHNAGWQERYTDLFYRQEDDVPDLKEALRIAEPRQVYKPGTVLAYSNYGASLAGYIVERQSGQPFIHTLMSIFLGCWEWRTLPFTRRCRTILPLPLQEARFRAIQQSGS
ncbi:hypothetical protein AWJ19_27405 [Paenibacillus sp. DMB5]|nr:hypothetical protein AWJ19_27405 [Paenibacillus sp. DMB5]